MGGSRGLDEEAGRRRWLLGRRGGGWEGGGQRISRRETESRIEKREGRGREGGGAERARDARSGSQEPYKELRAYS